MGRLALGGRGSGFFLGGGRGLVGRASLLLVSWVPSRVWPCETISLSVFVKSKLFFGGGRGLVAPASLLLWVPSRVWPCETILLSAFVKLNLFKILGGGIGLVARRLLLLVAWVPSRDWPCENILLSDFVDSNLFLGGGMGLVARAPLLGVPWRDWPRETTLPSVFVDSSNLSDLSSERVLNPVGEGALRDAAEMDIDLVMVGKAGGVLAG